MNISATALHIKKHLSEADFYAVFSWALFYPHKSTKLYFLVFAALVLLFSGMALIKNRYRVSSSFNTWLTVCNLLLAASIIFSPSLHRSLLFYADILLISLFFLQFSLRRSDSQRIFVFLTAAGTVFSAAVIAGRISGMPLKPGLFFANPILQGIVSGLGVLLGLYFLKKKKMLILLLPLLINLAGVYLSESKAAFIGTLGFALLMTAAKNKKVLLLILGLAMLTFLVPNPMRRMFRYSLFHDPYAANRIDIWQMSGRMALHYLPFGCGLGSYAAAAPPFNFPQTRGPANYFKLPRQPHNDALKLLTESGLFGLTVLLILATALWRGLFYRFSGLHALLCGYLLFQAMLFNLIFQLPFMLLFVFLLFSWHTRQRNYFIFSHTARFACACLLVCVFCAAYVLPFGAEKTLGMSTRSHSPRTALSYAGKASRLTPADPLPFRLSAEILTRRFKHNGDLTDFVRARTAIRRAQKLDPCDSGNFMVEAELLRTQAALGYQYPGLKPELMDSLKKARACAPKDPFILMNMAHMLLDFNDRDAARSAARSALVLEPDFTGALVFLERNFVKNPDKTEFFRKIRLLLKKGAARQSARSAYLFQLFNLSEDQLGWLRSVGFGPLNK